MFPAPASGCRLSSSRILDFALPQGGCEDHRFIDLAASLELQLTDCSLMLGHRDCGPAETTIASLDKSAGWPTDRDPRLVARIIFDKQLAFRPPDVGCQGVGPVPDIAEMDPVAPQRALIVG